MDAGAEGAGDERVSFELIRRWLIERKKTISITKLAKEIPIPRSSLHKTLTVPDSYPDANLGKLTEWYVRDRRAHFGSLQGADRVIQLMDTFDSLLPHERAGAAKELAEAYERIFRKRRAAVPPWVEGLRRASPDDLSGGGPGDPPKRPKGRKKK